jgi:ketosteroid isomerase-like protein
LFKPTTSAARPETTSAASAAPTASVASAPAAAGAPVSTEQALLEADRRLGVAAQEKGLAPAVAELSDADAVVLTPIGAFEKPDAILKGLASTSRSGPLFWQPERASAAASGDFGSTAGRYVQVLQGQEAVQGRYITVWRKDASGRWRILSSTLMPAPRPAVAAKVKKKK